MKTGGKPCEYDEPIGSYILTFHSLFKSAILRIGAPSSIMDSFTLYQLDTGQKSKKGH
jgi:hypothetical protein